MYPSAVHPTPPLRKASTRKEEAPQLSPSPRLRGEGRGEGRFFKFGEEHLENPVEILGDIVVPDPDHAITEGAELVVAQPVFRHAGRRRSR